MWTVTADTLSGGNLVKYGVYAGSAPLSFLEAVDRWREDADFRGFFIATLRAAPFACFRWETPPLTSADRDFEFVLVDSPGLAGAPDRATFAGYFESAQPGDVVEFRNLGGDAVLVAPCPQDASSDYAHLGAFLRNAPDAQQHSLWQAVGKAMQARVGDRPVWLSTAGGGVDWLHLRLDERPKYYAYAPYRRC